MKFNKKIAILFISVLLLLISLGIYLGLSSTASPTIAFYNVSEKTQKAITDILEANSTEKFSTITLDSNKSLEDQKQVLKKAGILIFINDLENLNTLEGRSNKKSLACPLDMSFTEGYPSSVINSLKNQKSTKADGSVLYLPFLFDFYQIDVNLPFYQQTQMETLETWDHLAEACYKEIPFTKNPLFLPLGDDSTFLTTLGIITEALCSYQAYDQLLEDFSVASSRNMTNDFEDLLEKYTEEGACLNSVIKELGSMIRSGIIPRDSLKMNSNNLTFFMDNDLCGMTLVKLSEHRKLSKDASKHISSIYCPSKEFTPERKFATEEISLALLKNKESERKLAKALTADFQGDLATQTGLAPVQKNCTVPDHQADDVRFWLAASKGPVMPLANVFENDAERKAAADYLRNQILSEIE